ncbi:MAG: hypothetical protein H6810_08170 [Phycisphaeraceae bacterium]|nr:MAG: hypothetical protein H6810_08170 [Phycisphaeraceae bacterium]
MKTIAIMSVAGLAAAATAASLSVDFSASATTVNVGDTVHWTCTVSFTGYGAGAYFGGFVGNFDATDAAFGTASNFVSHMAGNATTPVAAGASVNTINIFNSALLGSDDPSNPYLVMEWDVTADGGAASLSYGATGTWSQFPNDGIFSLPDTYTAPDITSDTVLVPAPGVLALAGLGGLTAARRRR